MYLFKEKVLSACFNSSSDTVLLIPKLIREAHGLAVHVLGSSILSSHICNKLGEYFHILSLYNLLALRF